MQHVNSYLNQVPVLVVEERSGQAQIPHAAGTTNPRYKRPELKIWQMYTNGDLFFENTGDAECSAMDMQVFCADPDVTAFKCTAYPDLD